MYNKYERPIIYPSGKIIAHDNRYVYKLILYITFIRILKNMNIITKVEFKPNRISDWIIINDGLLYGDNIFLVILLAI